MPANLPKPQVRASGGSPDARLVYAFTVVMLATFLAGLILFRPPTTGHEASVTLVATQGAPDAKTEAATAIGEPEVLSVITQEALVRRALARSVPSPNAATTDQDAAEVQKSVRVAIHRPAERVTRITITCNRANPDRALALVDQLGREFVATRSVTELGSAAEAERRRRDWDAVEARHYELRVKSELDAFVHEQISTTPAAASLAPPSPSPLEPQIEPGSEVNASPADIRRELEQQLAELTDERTALLNRVTPEHPDLAKIESRIEDLQTQLAQLPFSPPDTSATPATGGSEPQRDLSIKAADADPMSAQATQQWNRLKADLEQAARRREAADHLRHRTIGSSSNSSGWEWRVEPCQLVGRTSEAPSMARVAMLGLAAVLVAAGITRLAHAARVYSTFSTIKELETAVLIPIVGRIPAASGPSVARSKSRRWQTVRTAVLLSELVVAAAVVCISFAVLAGRPGAEQLSTDPFLAISRLFVNFPRVPL